MVLFDSPVVKMTLDIGSVSITVASLLALVPHITAVLSLVWVCFRLYELKTIQKWLGKDVKDDDE